MRDRDDVRTVREALTDVWLVVRSLGLEKGAKRQPRGAAVVCCPVHGDRTPSCSVRIGPDGTIQVKCFACDFGGDVLALVGAVRGLDLRADFRAVLTDAAEMANIRLDDPDRRERPAPPRRALPPEPERLTDEAFDRIAADVLTASPLAGDVAAYLDRRGLLEQARAAGVGALPSRQAPMLAELARAHGARALALSGLARVQPDGRPALDRLAWNDHRLLIPWFGPGIGAPIASLQRRRLDAGEPRYVSPPGRRSPFPYGVERVGEEATKHTAIVFVEGALDVLAARALYRDERLDRVVLGIPGLANWRPEWAAYAKGRRAIVAVDSDAAGERAVDAMLVDLIAAGATRITRSETVRGKDWAMAAEALR